MVRVRGTGVSASSASGRRAGGAGSALRRGGACAEPDEEVAVPGVRQYARGESRLPQPRQPRRAWEEAFPVPIALRADRPVGLSEEEGVRYFVRLVGGILI